MPGSCTRAAWISFRLNSKLEYLRHPPCILKDKRSPTPLVRSDHAARVSAQNPPRQTVPRQIARPRRHRRSSTQLSAAGAHPFSSFEKTLQGREAVEENLYIRDKEAAAKYKREAELQAERFADASKAPSLGSLANRRRCSTRSTHCRAPEGARK